MIGALLNYIQRGYKASLNISAGNQFAGNIFGYGTRNYTITSGTFLTNKDLSFKNGNSLEFHDLTVEHGAVLSPICRNGGTKGSEALYGPWSVLMLKCSGTLTVNGIITSANTGMRSYFYDDVNVVNTRYTPIPLSIGEKIYWGNYGFSTPAIDFFRLQNYGLNNSLFTKKLFLVGGGAGGNHKYGHHNRHNEHSRNCGFSCGGGTAGNSYAWGGNGGGFVAIYYEHLIIDGKEYGVDAGCDISRISANGISWSQMSGMDGGSSRSGGCIVIAAKTIIINNGSINSDGGYGIQEWSNAAVITDNYVNRRRTPSYKYALLNNIPQICPANYRKEAQIGLYWDPQANDFVTGASPNMVYYYDDGTGNGICNQSIQGSDAEGCGGAGVALGFKVR